MLVIRHVTIHYQQRKFKFLNHEPYDCGNFIICTSTLTCYCSSLMMYFLLHICYRSFLIALRSHLSSLHATTQVNKFNIVENRGGHKKLSILIVTPTNGATHKNERGIKSPHYPVCIGCIENYNMYLLSLLYYDSNVSFVFVNDCKGQ